MPVTTGYIKSTGIMPVKHTLNLADIGRGACFSTLQVSVLILLIESDIGEIFLVPCLHLLSHTIPSNRKLFLRLIGAQVECFLICPWHSGLRASYAPC